MTSYDFIKEEDIHLRQKIKPERDLFLVLVLVVVFVIDAFALVCLFANNFVPALMFHAVSFLILLGVSKLKEHKSKDARFAWIATIAVPVMGPLAPVGVLFALLWHYMSNEKSLTFREWRDSIFPPEHKTLAQTVYDRITFGRDQAGEGYSVTYLMDVIKMGNDEKKREAIFKILRNYDPSFAPLLKMALEDKHNAIRVQAATAITKLKNTFFSQSVKLERLRRDWPKKNIILLELAKHYDNYAFSGLLDDKQETENRLLSLHYYKEFIMQEPEDTPQVLEVHQLLGRLLFRRGKIEEASRQFEKLRTAGYATSDVNLWYSECLFNLKRYAELRTIAAESAHSALVTDSHKYPDHIRAMILLWANAKEHIT